jgi:hypothetical protein
MYYAYVFKCFAAMLEEMSEVQTLCLNIRSAFLTTALNLTKKKKMFYSSIKAGKLVFHLVSFESQK